jgi:hypothetical protein
METLLIINIVATIFTAYWLTEKNKAQVTIINALKTQLDTINPFVDIIKKVADPAEIDRLLAVKVKLLEHDIEIQRRQIIDRTSKDLQKEWSKRFEIDVKQKYGDTYGELANFVVMYFSKENFPDKIERNIQIKDFFPNMSEYLIKYIDEVMEKTTDEKLS